MMMASFMKTGAPRENQQKASLKKPKGKIKIPKIEEQIIQWSKGQTLIYETLNRKLKIYM
jgi:hypothetical protein